MAKESPAGSSRWSAEPSRHLRHTMRAKDKGRPGCQPDLRTLQWRAPGGSSSSGARGVAPADIQPEAARRVQALRQGKPPRGRRARRELQAAEAIEATRDDLPRRAPSWHPAFLRSPVIVWIG